MENNNYKVKSKLSIGSESFNKYKVFINSLFSDNFLKDNPDLDNIDNFPLFYVINKGMEIVYMSDLPSCANQKCQSTTKDLINNIKANISSGKIEYSEKK